MANGLFKSSTSGNSALSDSTLQLASLYKSQQEQIKTNRSLLEEYQQQQQQQSGEQNNGGFFGGIGYALEKVGLGFLQSIEGIWDYTAGGIAKLFGADDWAEQQFSNDWVNYSHAEDWFNPSKGWQFVGDVAGGIGTSLPAIATVATAALIAAASGGTLAPVSAALIAGTVAGLGAAGIGTKQAYQETGELNGKAFGYGTLTGLTEALVEGVSAGIGAGTGAAVKGITKAFGKEVAESVARQSLGKTLLKSFVGEAFEEGLSEFLDPYWQRITYNPDAKNATFAEIGYAALIGGLSGAIMGGTSAVITDINAVRRGNNLVNSGKASDVLALSQSIATYETENNTGLDALKLVKSTYETLQTSLAQTNGQVSTMQQRMMLGYLERANVSAALTPFVVSSAENIVANADTIAQKFTAYGFKDTNGKPITFTAEQIRSGVDMSNLLDAKNPAKPTTVEKVKARLKGTNFERALRENTVLRTLAVADATGKLVMDTNKFKEATLQGQKLSTQADLNYFVENATEAEKKAVAEKLGISDWNTLTNDDFIGKIQRFFENGGVEEYRGERQLVDQIKAAAEENTKSKNLPKTFTSNTQGEGVVRYNFAGAEIAIVRTGDTYRIYDYASDRLSKPLTVSEVRNTIRDIRTSEAEISQRVESAARETAELHEYAQKNIKGYSELNAPNQRMIRNILRQGRAVGIEESFLLSSARVATRSGLNVIFNEKLCFVEQSGEFSDGALDIKNNRIVINPNAKSRSVEKILIHELTHAIYVDPKKGLLLAKGRKLMTRSERDRITSRYVSVGITADEVLLDEINAHFAEETLSNKNILERLVREKPSIKDRILNFFKGAHTDYAGDTKLTGAAKRLYAQYSKLFDKFAKRNQQMNAYNNPNNTQNITEPVRNALSQINYNANNSTIERDANGQYLSIDLDADAQKQLSALSVPERRRFVREYINRTFRNIQFTMQDGRVANVTGTGAAKISESGFLPKQQTALELDKLLSVAEYKSTAENPTHKKFSRFDYYTARVQIGGEMYSCVLNVGETRDGGGLYQIYDVNQFNAEKKDAPTVLKPQQGSADSLRPIRNASSTNSISQNEEKSTPTRKKNGKVRYALSLGDEMVQGDLQKEGNLVALHNLSEQSLLKVLKLGGFPMPSIAITTVDMGHTEFGDITVVFGRDTIDPQADSRNKVYSRDGWTPTAPLIDYKTNEEVMSRIHRKHRALVQKVGNEAARPLYNLVYDMESQLRFYGGELGLIRSLYDDTNMMNLFLADTGDEYIQPIRKEIRSELPEADVTYRKRIIAALGEDFLNQWRDIKKSEDRKAFISEHKAQIVDALASVMQGKESIEQTKADISQNFSTFGLGMVLNKAVNYMENGGISISSEIDSAATQEAIKRSTSKQKYVAWLERLLGGVAEKTGIYNGKDPYTNSGNRRSFEQLHYEYTLDNMVRAMSESGEKGKSSWNGLTLGQLQAKLSKEFRSIDEIRLNADKLTARDEAAHKQFSETARLMLNEITKEMVVKSRYSDDVAYWQALDSAQLVVGEIADNKLFTLDKIAAFMKREYSKSYNYNDSIGNKILGLFAYVQTENNTDYFEAKPRRAVTFSEIKRVLLPETASEKLITELESRNIPYQIYDTRANARTEAIRQLSGVRFALDMSRRQEKTSAATSINSTKLPVLYGKVQFESGTVNLDIGGGKFDNVTEYLATKGVKNYIYDPYNRSEAHNAAVAAATQEGQSDTVTISNVLNVIDSIDGRRQVLENAVDAVKPNGTVYITVYEGDGSGIARSTGKDQFQLNRKTNDYVVEVQEYFDDVVVKNKVIIAKSPKKVQANIRYALPGTDSQGRKLSENQRKFFAKSKVVDAQGRLLPVFHGTHSGDFTVFEHGKAHKNDAGWLGEGFYFYGDEHEAQMYAMNGGRVVEAYLNVENPYYATAEDMERLAEVDDVAESRKFSEALIADGYDGVYYNGDLRQEWVVFSPNQIKLTTNSNPTHNIDIRYALPNTDSQERKLTSKQREFFQNTVAVDENGKLRVEYHGTNAQFYTFRNQGQNSRQMYGVGFYFTPYQDEAAAYGKRIIQAYLNVQQPIIFGEKHITETQWKQYLDYCKEHAGEYVEGVWTGNAITSLDYKDVIDAKSDNVLVSDFINHISGGSGDVAVSYLRMLKDSLGYDGIQRGEYLIVFTPEQIKRVSNTAPTTGTDIRYALQKDDIPHQNRGGLSVGQRRKFVANNTRMKFYSRSDAETMINTLIESDLNFPEEYMGGEVSTRTRREVIDYLFQRLNTADERYQLDVAANIVDYIMENASLSNYFESDMLGDDVTSDAVARLSAIRKYMHKMNLSGIREDINHKFDKKNNVFLVWGKKTGGITADVVAMNLQEVGINIEATNEADCFFAILDEYESARRTASTKAHEIALNSFGTEEQRNAMRQKMIKDLLLAFDQAGTPSKFSKLVDKYTSRIDTLKQELRESQKRNKLVNNIIDTAQYLRDISEKRNYVGADVLQAPELTAWLKQLGKVKFRSDMRKTGVRQIFVDFGKFYNMENSLLYDRGNPTELNYIDQNVLDAIEFLKESLVNDGKTLTVEELQAMQVIMSAVKKLYSTYDQIRFEGKQQNLTTLAQQGNEILERSPNHVGKGFFNRIYGIFNKIVEPRVVIRSLENYDPNGILTRAYQEVTNGETQAGLRYIELMSDFDSFFKRHKKYSRRLASERVNVAGANLTWGQAITLYELSRRPQAQEGLYESGFSYMDERNAKRSVRVTEADIEALAQQFSDADKEFIVITDRFFNVKSKEMKTRADTEILGYTNVSDEFYIPITRDSGTIARNVTDARDIMSDWANVYNFSFNKDVKAHSKNKLFVGDIYSIITRHAKQLSTYAELTIPLKNFSQLYVKNIGTKTNVRTLKNTISENVWDGADSYLRKLFSDIQGRATSSSFVEKLRGAYAKYQLGANLKVIVSQVTSYPTAGIYLDFRSMVRGAVMKTNYQAMDQYCPFARVRNYERGIVRAEGVIDKIGKVGDALTKPIQWTDRMTIGKIWNACQVQVQKDTGAKLGTVENMKQAGVMLEEVVRLTQPNYTNSERSELMRSDSDIVRSFTMFTSVPLKQLSRLVETIGEYRTLRQMQKSGTATADIQSRLKVSRRKMGRVLGAITTANLMYVLVGQFFKWLYNKDRKDKDGNEIGFVLDFTNDFASTTIGMFPIVRDIYNYFVNDYEFSNFAIDMLDSLFSATKGLFEYAVSAAQGEPQDSTVGFRLLRDSLYAIGQMTGIPIRNINNTLSGLIKRFDPATAYKYNSLFYNGRYSQDLKSAIEKGDSRLAATIMDLLLKKDRPGGGSNNLTNKLLSLYEKGYDVLPKSIGNKITVAGEEITLTKEQQAKFQKLYGKSTAVVEQLIVSPYFTKLSEDLQAQAIKQIYNAYYEYARSEITGEESNNVALLLTYIGNMPRNIAILTQLKNISPDVNKRGEVITGSKKAKAIKYILSQRLSDEERLLLLTLAGYTIGDREYKTFSANGVKAKLLKYILRLKCSQSVREQLAQKCGFTVKNGKIIGKQSGFTVKNGRIVFG